MRKYMPATKGGFLMRCRTIRKKIVSVQGKLDAIYNDPTIGSHLNQCPSCDLFAKGEMSLGRDLETARTYTPATDLPLTVVRENLKARITVHHKQPSFFDNLLNYGGRVMNLATEHLKKRPKLGLSFALAAIVLLIAVTIPFNIGQNIEYQVAFATVDPDLKLDAEQLRRALSTLEIESAYVDVIDCATRCRVTVSHLKNLDEVRIVLAAFDEIGNCVVEDISESKTPAKSTLLKVVGENMFIEGRSELMDDMLKANFNEMSGNGQLNFPDGQYVFWEKDEDDESGETLKEMFTLNQKNGRTIITMAPDINEMNQGDKPWWANASVLLDDPQGNEHVFYLDDPDDLARLVEMGLDIETMTWRNGAPEWPTETDEFVEESADDRSGFALSNHPNPFNPSTTIIFSLSQSEHVTVDIYNIRGQKVRRLIDGPLSAGEHSIEWNSTDDGGNRVASGVYFCRLQAGEKSTSKKMVLTK